MPAATSTNLTEPAAAAAAVDLAEGVVAVEAAGAEGHRSRPAKISTRSSTRTSKPAKLPRSAKPKTRQLTVIDQSLCPFSPGFFLLKSEVFVSDTKPFFFRNYRLTCSSASMSSLNRNFSFDLWLFQGFQNQGIILSLTLCLFFDPPGVPIYKMLFDVT